jgi:hypothetical protein
VNFNFSNTRVLPGDFVQFLAILWMALVVIVHVSFMIGVFVDARALAQKRGSTTFVAPLIWAAATLIGGILTVLVYWIVHRSTLNPPALNSDEPETETH